MERSLAAILAADVVGYSRLMAADETGTHARLKALRQEVIQPRVTAHRGRVVKLMGDGLLAEFSSVVDAVECAVAVQSTVAGRDGDLPEEHRVVLRIGVSLGDVIHDQGDVYGDGVNVAARLEAVAQPGGIAVADHAMQVLDEKLRVTFAAGEICLLKNIPRPIKVWRWPATEVPRPRPVPAVAERPTIAVLPFDDLSPSRDQAHLCRGIAEDIITELSRFRSLFVIDRNSSFASRPAAGGSVLARRLGAEFLLSGSVRVGADRMRINAQLVNATTDEQVWAQRFDRRFADIFDVQDEVVQSIVCTMVGRLEESVARAARRKPPDNLTAYDLVLQGTELLHRHDRADGEKARELFERAIELDPDYGLAHVRLAQTYLNEFFWDDSGAALQQAHRHAGNALQIDDGEGWSHLIIAIAYLHERNFTSAEHHLRRALDRNPSDATLLAKCGLLLTDLGQPKEAIAWLERAARLDPLREDAYADYLGLALFSAGRYREAAQAFEVTAEPKFYDHVWLAATYASLDEPDKAKRHAMRVLELEPEFTIARFRRLEPYKSEADLGRWVDALRKAGLPE